MASADPDPFSAKQADRAPLEVAPEHTALLLVDLVNDFVEPDGAMPLAQTDAVLAANADLARRARVAGALPVWIRPGHREAADGLFRKRIRHGMDGSWGAELHANLGAEPGERVISKRRYSAFFATDLDLYLREHDIRRTVVTGVALNICVRSTVHDAFFLGYDVWVVRDACMATGAREEESTLYDIETHFGRVVDAAEVVEAWT